jgi:hypothetical protein
MTPQIMGLESNIPAPWKVLIRRVYATHDQWSEQYATVIMLLSPEAQLARTTDYRKSLRYGHPALRALAQGSGKGLLRGEQEMNIGCRGGVGSGSRKAPVYRIQPSSRSGIRIRTYE